MPPHEAYDSLRALSRSCNMKCAKHRTEVNGVAAAPAAHRHTRTQEVNAGNALVNRWSRLENLDLLFPREWQIDRKREGAKIRRQCVVDGRGNNLRR
jgi:hypothetical protein